MQILVVTTDARVEERGAHVILADRVETLSATYGVLMDGASRPATFVIDPNGVIRFEYRAGQKPGRVFVNDENDKPRVLRSED